MTAARPHGFPKATWALLGSPDQLAEVRRRWADVKHNPPNAELIVAEALGVDRERLRRRQVAARQQRLAAQHQSDIAAPIRINCDGLCEPRNPGGTATFGWVARRGPELLGSDCGVAAKGPAATNNLAEYTAIIEALRWLIATGRGGENVELRSDSQLAINQLTGAYQVRSAAIRPLWSEANRLARRCPRLRLRWVPRESNAEADALTRKAYAESLSPEQVEQQHRGRSERAETLASRVEQVGPDHWRVPSSSGRGFYDVRLGDTSSCTCPDFAHRRLACKHMLAVQLVASGV